MEISWASRVRIPPFPPSKLRHPAERISDGSLTFKDVFNISFSAQNPNDVNDVFIYKIINLNGFKSRNRSRAQILKLRLLEE